ncbi:hypothetical protein, partial [Vibrio sp. T9]|uniref:hypothetical protein n=1 Tax=Vibrio sp. T9 TaxID=2007196 RepID=UPI001A8F7CA7
MKAAKRNAMFCAALVAAFSAAASATVAGRDSAGADFVGDAPSKEIDAGHFKAAEASIAKALA